MASVTGNYRLGIAVDDQGDGIDVHWSQQLAFE